MNQSTRGQWDFYANHRREIERLIVPGGRDGRICVLGAGNCNDLDLKWLAEAYAEVHLVDIDRGALERAVVRQGVAGNESVKLHAPIDLTGIADLTAGWKGRKVSEAEVNAAIERRPNLESVNVRLEKFDVVLSPCVLSQLLCGVRDLVGKDHSGWPKLKAALRARHLGDLMGLVACGGRGVLVIDLASTSAIPGLDRARDEEVDGLMRMSVRDRKCFRGLEPSEIQAAMRDEPTLRDNLGQVEISRPWIWHLGFGKAFLVYGMTMVRNGAAENAVGLRYAILHHTGIAQRHFDLLFESKAGSPLIAWRSANWPILNEAAVERIADHRQEYLEYEGPISGDRGEVRRVAGGTFLLEWAAEDYFRVRTDGGIILSFRRQGMTANWLAEIE